jgi:tetratricopeptide (TPR) repeat protein
VTGRWGARAAALGLAVALAASSGAQAAAPASSAEALLARARACAAEGRSHISLRILDEILEKDADLEPALALRAEILREDGRLDEACEDYERWAAARPDEAAPWFWLATLDRWRGRLSLALAEYDRVLAIEPCHVGARNGRARVLRARGEDDVDDLRAALACSPGDPEATALLAGSLARRREEYLRAGAGPGAALAGSGRFAFLEGELDRREVVEGLDEEGLEVGGTIVVPTEILYETDHARAGLVWELPGENEAAAEVSFGNEAVVNRGRRERDGSAPPGGPGDDTTIYDFDVFRGLAGTNHRIGGGWRFSWRAGAVGYRSNAASTVADENEALAGARLEWRGVDATFTSAYDRDTFLRRGFAGDTQFRIFRRDLWRIEARRAFAAGVTMEAGVGGAHHDDGNDVLDAWTVLGISRTSGSARLRARHEPLAARFLDEDRGLDFIAFDALSLDGWKALAAGFRLEGELLAGRFGETPRSVVDEQGRLVDGPADHNVQRRARASASWAPPPLRVLTFGAEYFAEEFDFDTAPYNTIDVHAWTFLAGLELHRGESLSFDARYARGLLGDERSSDYSSDLVTARVEAKGARAASPRLAIDGRWGRTSLDETTKRARAELTVPF